VDPINPSNSRRWQRAAAVAAVTLALCIVFLNVQRPSGPQRSAPLEARLELAAGAVTVDTGQGAVPAISGTALPVDATVTSGKGARALIRLSEGSSIFLRDETSVKLSAGGVSLLGGEMWMDAPPTDRKPSVHKINDVTVAAADAGLSIKSSADSVSVYVARGLAVVTGPGGRVEAGAGELALVKGTAAPEVKPVTFWEDWTGGMGDHGARGGSTNSGAGTIYGVDIGGTHGTPARTLEVARQSVRAVIRDGLAETEVDQTFFNPNTRPVEGWYWFSVPEGASVTGFALETDGVLVEGELTERSEAAAHYAAAVRSGHEPALLEWIDRRTFRARIYPVPGAGTRRVVLRYMELIPVMDGRLRYVYPLQTREPTRVGEFALTVDLGDAGTRMAITTLADARIEENGRRITMRRSGFKPLADFQLEARVQGSVPALRVARHSPGRDSADYLMARYVPDLAWDEVESQKGQIVLVVDTSAAGDDASRQLKTAAAEGVLRALSASDQFALVSLDVKPTVLYPREGLANATETEITTALERLAEHPAGGSTDLASLFDVALGRLHGAEQPAVIYVGDGYPTSGEMSTEQLTERLSRALSTSRARFFTVAVGGDANLPLMGELARAGGGQMFTVDDAEQTTERSLRLAAAVKTPTVTEFEMDLGAGLDEVFVSANGKVTRGDEVILLARSHHEIPSTVTVRGRLAGKKFERSYPVTFEPSVATSLVPRLWAAESMRRILGTVGEQEGMRGKIITMGIEYGLMTPFTSFIALDSEAAYQQQGIPRRRSPLRGVRLSQLTPPEEELMLARLGGVVAAASGLGCGRLEAPASISMPMERDEAEPAEMARSVPMQKSMPSAPPAPVMLAKEAKAEAAAEVALASGGEGYAGALGGVGMGGGGGRAKASIAANRQDTGGKKDQRAPEAQKKALVERPVPDNAPVSVRPAAMVALRTCSDAAKRPLSERSILWEKRIKGASGPADLINRYETAKGSCELTDWRAESRFFQVLQRVIRDSYTATQVLAYFGSQQESQKYLARLILRRAVDPGMVLAVERELFGSRMDWQAIDQELASVENPGTRLAQLRTHVARAPDDANGTIRLCLLLARTDHVAEALTLARRLREQGLLTPMMTRELGDLLARQNLEDDAMRTYSEIVEFDPQSTAPRQLVGDIYLAHGWYAPAYRQYKTLTEMEPGNWSAWLRLASAAAGSNRTDEALRLERRVFESEGTPGPADPRRWARLWSAARLARLIANPPPADGTDTDPKRAADGLKRKLKELQLFQGPGTLIITTWEDLAVNLGLTARTGKSEYAAGDFTDAADVGLSALLAPAADVPGLALTASVRNGAHSTPVKLTRHDITWDGKAFNVTLKSVELPADTQSAGL